MSTIETKKLRLTIELKNQSNALSISHHVLNIEGAIEKEVSKHWWEADITSLPISIIVPIPQQINGRFYIVLALVNKFTDQVKYLSSKQHFEWSEINDIPKSIVVQGKISIIDLFFLMLPYF